MVSAQDHRALDNDEFKYRRHENFSQVGFILLIHSIVWKKVYKATLDAMKKKETLRYIIFGLMLTDEGVKVLEYNARFGDPEAQVVLPRLKGDLLEVLEACVDKRLHELKVEWEDNAAVCVVLASGGYPLSYKKGYPIYGLDKFKDNNIIVFHAGTAKEGDNIVTNGGRVLGVTGIAQNLDEAIRTAYEGVEMISFENMHYRKDIGIK